MNSNNNNNNATAPIDPERIKQLKTARAENANEKNLSQDEYHTKAFQFDRCNRQLELEQANHIPNLNPVFSDQIGKNNQRKDNYDEFLNEEASRIDTSDPRSEVTELGINKDQLNNKASKTEFAHNLLSEVLGDRGQAYNTVKAQNDTALREVRAALDTHVSNVREGLRIEDDIREALGGTDDQDDMVSDSSDSDG